MYGEPGDPRTSSETRLDTLYIFPGSFGVSKPAATTAVPTSLRAPNNAIFARSASLTAFSFASRPASDLIGARTYPGNSHRANLSAFPVYVRACASYGE